MRNWQPERTSEVALFMRAWCDRCVREYGCSVLLTGVRGTSVPEWVYGEDGSPACMAFVSEYGLWEDGTRQGGA